MKMIWMFASAALFTSLLAVPGRATESSITSGFNGTNIADTSDIWFNSHITSVSGATAPFTIYALNQTITFKSPLTGIDYTLAIPDAQILVDPSISTASTIFSAGEWTTEVSGISGTPFLSGLAWDVPTGENPKAANVTWNADFFISPGQTGNVSLNWQWSAAVYTGDLSDNMENLGVTPIDGFGGYSQSGTPSVYASTVTGGARGGGGSNFTGSNSGTGSAECLAVVPEPSGALMIACAGMQLLLFRKRRFGKAR